MVLGPIIWLEELTRNLQDEEYKNIMADEEERQRFIRLRDSLRKIVNAPRAYLHSNTNKAREFDDFLLRLIPPFLEIFNKYRLPPPETRKERIVPPETFMTQEVTGKPKPQYKHLFSLLQEAYDLDNHLARTLNIKPF